MITTQVLSGDIEGRSVPSAAVFAERYARPNRPVVFIDATDQWRARSLWTLDWLKKTHGEPIYPDYFPRNLAQVIEEAQQAIQIAPNLNAVPTKNSVSRRQAK